MQLLGGKLTSRYHAAIVPQEVEGSGGKYLWKSSGKKAPIKLKRRERILGSQQGHP
jgi:hypothetical protein